MKCRATSVAKNLLKGKAPSGNVVYFTLSINHSFELCIINAFDLVLQVQAICVFRKSVRAGGFGCRRKGNCRGSFSFYSPLTPPFTVSSLHTLSKRLVLFTRKPTSKICLMNVSVCQSQILPHLHICM